MWPLEIAGGYNPVTVHLREKKVAQHSSGSQTNPIGQILSIFEMWGCNAIALVDMRCNAPRTFSSVDYGHRVDVIYVRSLTPTAGQPGSNGSGGHRASACQYSASPQQYWIINSAVVIEKFLARRWLNHMKFSIGRLYEVYLMQFRLSIRTKHVLFHCNQLCSGSILARSLIQWSVLTDVGNRAQMPFVGIPIFTITEFMSSFKAFCISFHKDLPQSPSIFTNEQCLTTFISDSSSTV